MQQTISVALNIKADGATVLTGEHSPGTSTGISYEEAGLSTERVEQGVYRVHGPEIAIPEGWRASVFRDENDQPTVFLSIMAGQGFIEYRCTHPGTAVAKDIVNLLTVRVMVTIEVPDMPDIPAPDDEMDAGQMNPIPDDVEP